MTLRIPAAWDDAFDELDGLVFVAKEVSDDWDSVANELDEAFRLTRSAAQNGVPITYVVRNDDLLGRRGPAMAMIATGLLSGARTAALELAKSAVAVNVLAVEDDTDPAIVARWVRLAMEPNGPTGELIHLGAAHIGKALA